MSRKEGFYDQLSWQQRNEMHQKNYEIQKKIQNKENPYKDNIIKVGTYTYCHQESTYEEKINKLLDELNVQEVINKTVEEQKEKNTKLKEILSRNSMQVQATRIVDDNSQER